MNTIRLNITIPKDLFEVLKGVKSKSAFIAEAIREYIEKMEKERIVAALREGYSATRDEDAEITKEWEATTGDGID